MVQLAAVKMPALNVNLARPKSVDRLAVRSQLHVVSSITTRPDSYRQASATEQYLMSFIIVRLRCTTAFLARTVEVLAQVVGPVFASTLTSS